LGDLAAEQLGAPPVELARDGVSLLGESLGFDGEGGDLALLEGLGVDERGDRLDAARAEELDRGFAQRRLGAGPVAVVQRGADRLDAEPVAAALVAEQVPPPADAPAAAVEA